MLYEVITKGCIDKGAYINPQVLQVPLVMKPPKESYLSIGTSIDQPVSLLDIMPTIAEFSGIEVTQRIDGLSLTKTASYNFV